MHYQAYGYTLRCEGVLQVVRDAHSEKTHAATNACRFGSTSLATQYYVMPNRERTVASTRSLDHACCSRTYANDQEMIEHSPNKEVFYLTKENMNRPRIIPQQSTVDTGSPPGSYLEST